MNEISKIFQEKGVTVLKKLCTDEVIETITKSVQKNIEHCTKELNCSLTDYLSNVSRWVHPSPVTKEIYTLAVSELEKSASDFIDAKVQLVKMNIISKSTYADKPVPCHQDISYSRENPYEFSLWLALQDVGLEDGVLEFLPESHLKKIEPAIDFWQPDFVDNKYFSADWQQNKIAVPVKAGDAIAFDSRIWHRSAQNKSGSNRFALVTRWSRINYQPPNDIPEKNPAAFGMWTCGKVTEKLLQQGLIYCFQVNSTASLFDCIHIWQEKLEQSIKLPFLTNRLVVRKALKDVYILHCAAERHNGGDAQGIVYANLWHHFLLPLSQWLNQLTDKQKEIYYERAI
jgi:ectoine hydroxylase-related dioxygenase (phytanoyl-CoA dioxygenase family)